MSKSKVHAKNGKDAARTFQGSVRAHRSAPRTGTNASPVTSRDLSGISVLPAGPAVVQAKLEIGEPDDEYEKEADRVADTVMRMPDPGANGRVQRMCAGCEEEESLQRSAQPGVAAPAAGHEAAVRSVHGGRPLGEPERAFFEPRFGVDFSRVRIHEGAQADAAARSVGARAYTLGSDVVVRRDQPSFDSSSGRRLLAHELTHVVQQNGLGGAVLRRLEEPDLDEEEG